MTAAAAATAAQRWAALGDTISPGLIRDPHWNVLAGSLDRAAAAGFDVIGDFPNLATHGPLPEAHIARTLEYMLIDACPAALRPPTPQVSQAGRDHAEAEALERMAAADRISSSSRSRAAPQPALRPETEQPAPTPAPSHHPRAWPTPPGS